VPAPIPSRVDAASAETCDDLDVSTTTIPQYHELMWPALIALKELGGSATVREMYERVVEDEHFSEEQQAVPTKDGRMPESSTVSAGRGPTSRESARR